MFYVLLDRGSSSIHSTIYGYLRDSSDMHSTIYAYLRDSSNTHSTFYAYLRDSSNTHSTFYAYLRGSSKAGASPLSFWMLPGPPLDFSILDGCLELLLKVIFLYWFLSILLSGVLAPFLGIAGTTRGGACTAPSMRIYVIPATRTAPSMRIYVGIASGPAPSMRIYMGIASCTAPSMHIYVGTAACTAPYSSN